MARSHVSPLGHAILNEAPRSSQIIFGSRGVGEGTRRATEQKSRAHARE
jgi:hypothetical protein